MNSSPYKARERCRYEEDQLFRRLNYNLTSMHNMKKIAQQRLYRLATSLKDDRKEGTNE